MTSGHGGEQPGGQSGPQGAPPQGPPPAWNPPPGPPQYGQPYPGYAPAPSAPTGQGAPPPMERPDTVRAGVGAFIAALLVSLISSAVTVADFDAFVARAKAAADTADTPALTDEAIRLVLVAGLVVGLLFVALEIMFIAFAWKGRHWARVVLWVLGGLNVVIGLAGLSGNNGQTGFTTSMGWFTLLLTAAGIVLLALRPSNDWFTYRRWLRSTGQG
jgi:hypothetical protein